MREPTGLLGIDDVVVRRSSADGDGWRARGRGAADAVYEVDVRREHGEPTHLTCSTAQLRRPKRATSQEALADEPPDEHEPARVVERARQLARP